MTTTPTAEQLRHTIANELESLAQRVRDPSTYVEQTERSGTVSISRDNEILHGPLVTTLQCRMPGYHATLTVIGDAQVTP